MMDSRSLDTIFAKLIDVIDLLKQTEESTLLSQKQLLRVLSNLITLANHYDALEANGAPYMLVVECMGDTLLWLNAIDTQSWRTVVEPLKYSLSALKWSIRDVLLDKYGFDASQTETGCVAKMFIEYLHY